MSIEAKNIIGGEFIEGCTGEKRERYNPATGELVGSFIASTSEDVEDAIYSARKAFEDSPWATDPKLRVRVLREMSEAILHNLEHLSKIQTSENGKILKDSRRELTSAADLFDYYSGLVRSVTGRTHMPDNNTMSFVVREPMGVVGIIAWPDLLPLLWQQEIPWL
jgi:acyl-CoA reductase-like NAD-dependent aldehyde dehydrogenase